MREWSNPYNPFNSMKVLLWKEHLEGIVKGEFLPPITVNSDLTNECNYNCIWCNAFDYRQGEKHSLPKEHLIRLADFYKEWGVRSTCIAGGGEPLLNPGLNSFLKRLNENGIECGIVTNGSLMTEEHIDVIARTSRWCGFSMDAATPKTYVKVKGIYDEGFFYKVIENIKTLTERVKGLKGACAVAFKFLLHPLNALEIFEAARFAKRLGVRDFHMRPVGWENIAITKDKPPISFEHLVDDIDRQIEMAMELEDEGFHFYGVRHKFDPRLKRKVGFSRCWATPLLATFGANGKCHLCFDMRGRKDLVLSSHYPDQREILKVWGSRFHKELIAKIDPNTCPRCTFGPYNEIIEKVVIEDGMCHNFP